MGSRSKNRNRNRQSESDRPQQPGEASQWTYSRPRAPPATAYCSPPPAEPRKHVERRHVPWRRLQRPDANIMWYALQVCVMIAPLCLMGLQKIGPGSGITAVGVAIALVVYCNRHPATHTGRQRSHYGTPAAPPKQRQEQQPQQKQQRQHEEEPEIPQIFYVQFDGFLFIFENIYGITEADFRVARMKGFDRCHGKGANYIRKNFIKTVHAEMKVLGGNSSSSGGNTRGSMLHDQYFVEWRQQQQGPLQKQLKAAAAAQPDLEGLSVAGLTGFLQQAGVPVPVESKQHRQQRQEQQEQLHDLARSSTKAWECKRLQQCGAMMHQYKHNQLLRLQAALCVFRLECVGGELPTVVAKREGEVVKREWQKLVRVVHPDKAVNEHQQHIQM
eukprot:GHUV01008022.1.p1 GENE.GHUV01008022.1~~GHUV01008022.1.p1  ORF type:complete len:387 (+),score=98.96 GHUV01008022.1:1396-2556(+)